MRWAAVLSSVFLALASVGCAKDTRVDATPVAYGMVVNPTSGVEMPRIRLPDRPKVEQRVNDQLDALAASLMCLDGGGTYSSAATVRHAANDVFSVQVGSSYYCGTPYPTNHADSSMTFDLWTGEAIAFKKLFEDYQRDGAEIAGAFVESLSAEDLDGCEDVLTVEELNKWQSFAYTISTQGLRVELSFPHVLAACNRQSIVAFGALRTFAAPESILTRIANAQPR